MNKLLLCLGLAAFCYDGFCCESVDDDTEITNTNSDDREEEYLSALRDLDTAMEYIMKEELPEEKLKDEIQLLSKLMTKDEGDIYHKAMVNENPTIDVLKECLEDLKVQLEKRVIPGDKIYDIADLMREFTYINSSNLDYYRETEESAADVKARQKKIKALDKKMRAWERIKKDLLNEGFDYLKEAITLGCEYTANNLIDSGVDFKKSNGSSYLYHAFKHAAMLGRIKVLRRLLRLNKIDIKNFIDRDVLYDSFAEAARRGKDDVVKFMFENKLIKKEWLPEALRQAAYGKKAHTVKLLLDLGAENTHHALVAATLRGDIEIMEILLDAGADPNKPDEYSDTAVEIAKLWKRRAPIELLQRHLKGNK